MSEPGLNSELSTTELIAGVPYRTPSYCTVLENGRVTRVEYVENNHRRMRFALADEWLQAGGLQAEAGQSVGTASLIKKIG